MQKNNIVKTEIIDKFLKYNKISKTKFCKMCKISYFVLIKIYNQQTNLDVKHFFKIARAMKIPVCELFY